MTGYELSPNARRGLFAILDDVESRFGTPIAERVLASIKSAFERLVDHPDIGHSRQDLTDNPQIQFWPVGPTLIAYRAGSNVIEILAVERGEREWKSVIEGIND